MGPSRSLRNNVLSGSIVMLVSSGIVGGLNLVYNLAVAHKLGASGFGHATAVYTVLMLLASLHLTFQIVCSKFVARSSDPSAKIAVYRHLLARAWVCSIGVGALLVASRGLISTYLNLPNRNYIVILAAAAVFYIPLGARRGLLQGTRNFRGLAFNFVLEASVKVGGTFLFLAWGWGVSGVIGAVVASEVLAFAFSGADARLLAKWRIGSPVPVALGEGLQASLFFAGQVVINNLDIVLVKHFFAATEAGVYAAVALVGRFVYVLSWSVVSAMFPFSADTSAGEESSRSALGTALALAASITALFTLGVLSAPTQLWHLMLGAHFPLNEGGSYRSLLALYTATTGIYSLAVVLMVYEISRKIGNVSWLQLFFSGAMIVGIYLIHNNLRDVILVQTVLLTALLISVSIPFLRVEIRNWRRPKTADNVEASLIRLRRVTEDETIAEFLKGEFFQPEFDGRREQFADIVNRPDLTNYAENRIRRCLLYLRRRRLWQEIPADTEWWEVKLDSAALRRLRVFPRGQWSRHSDRKFRLLDTTERIRSRIEVPADPFLTKLRSLSVELASNAEPEVYGTVLLIGTDENHPLTIIEGNHRITAAALVSPDDVPLRFRFLCGLSPHMMQCCWYNTSFSTLLRYAKNTITWLFDDPHAMLEKAVQDKALKEGLNSPPNGSWDRTRTPVVRSTGSSD